MYWIKQFGSVTLPTQQPDQYAGVGRATTEFLPLSGGGVYDSLGSGVATLQGTVIAFKGTISAASQDETDLESEFYTLRGLFGKRDLLYRQRSDTLTWEWCVARVIGINSQRRVENLRMLDVNIDFQMISPTWYGARHGAGWTLDSGEYFDTGLVLDEGDETVAINAIPKSATITNGGNAAVRNIEIVIQPGTLYEITNMIIQRTVDSAVVEDLVIATDLYRDHVLTVDCGRFTAVVSGPAWSDYGAGATVGLKDGVIGVSADGVERYYRCSVSGDLGASEPTWPTSGTVTDNTAEWTYVGTTDQFDNISLGAEHSTANWLTLEPGDNTLVLTRSAVATPEGHVDFNFYDGWV